MKRMAMSLAVLLAVASFGFGNAKTPQSRTQGISAGKTAGISLPKSMDRTRTEEPPEVVTIKISGESAGNKRYPGVAENLRGDRLVIFRGADNNYWFSYCKNKGSWTSPAAIPGQPTLNDHTSVDVAADSTDRFHCIWEKPDSCSVYGSFLDGQWTTPFKMALLGEYDMGVSIAVRSNDQVIAANGQILFRPLTKDVVFYFMDKGATNFTLKNMTHDEEGSCQPSIAVDSANHIWLSYKGELSMTSTSLDILLVEYNENNEYVNYWVLSDEDGWCFWPQTAVNEDGKVMSTWTHTQTSNYWSRLYDPATKKMSERVSVGIGIPVNPWAMFYSKLVAHGKDFYMAGMDPGRNLHLMKYDEETSRWNEVAKISDRGVEYFDVYSGYDKILVAWGTQEPGEIFLTTVGVAPEVRIQPAANLEVEKRVERGFFHGFTLNALTWEANPLNTERGITIAAQRVYRKLRTENADRWTRLVELAATARGYEDQNIPAGSDYVYAVTCVDDKGTESPIADEGQGAASAAAGAPKRPINTGRKIR